MKKFLFIVESSEFARVFLRTSTSFLTSFLITDVPIIKKEKIAPVFFTGTVTPVFQT